MRDPRVDPKPKDLLERSGVFRQVAAIAPDGRIRFHCRQGEQWLNSIYTETLDGWREWAKDAEVLHAAE